jgi:hypothetical protein
MTTRKRLTYQQVLEIARRGLSYIQHGKRSLEGAKATARLTLEMLPYSGTQHVNIKPSDSGKKL